jgi:hypothetical protein
MRFAEHGERAQHQVVIIPGVAGLPIFRYAGIPWPIVIGHMVAPRQEQGMGVGDRQEQVGRSVLTQPRTR